MTPISIVGVGMTPVGEHWGTSLRGLAAEAAQMALEDANITKLDALYVANAYGSTFNQQTNLGALIADYLNFHNIETFTVESADASGGAALRAGYLAVASGVMDTVMVLGVEKATDIVGSPRVRARNISLDADYEALHGATLPALAGLLMRRYMHEHQLNLDVFEPFSINAHANGSNNKHAMYRNKLREGAFAKAPMVASPVNLFDSAPDGDGAAAVILKRSLEGIHILSSAASSDRYMLSERADMLHFSAVADATQKALTQANISLDDLDLFELQDSFTIMSTLTLESAGLALRGQGWRYATDKAIFPDGKLPISTFGGMKSRGNPAGAAGIYQAVEATLQLLGRAGANQIQNANIAMIQNLGGMANTAFTHVLSMPR